MFAAVIHREDLDAEMTVRPRMITAKIIRGETHYVAECEQLSVVTQGATIDETIRNFREAVELHLED